MQASFLERSASEIKEFFFPLLTGRKYFSLAAIFNYIQ